MTGAEKVFEVALGGRLRQARQARGLSQRHAGDHLGVTPQQVQKYEAGIDRLSVAYLVALRDLYRVSINELVPADGDTPELRSGKQALRLLRDFEAIPSERVRTRLSALVRSLNPEGPRGSTRRCTRTGG